MSEVKLVVYARIKIRNPRGGEKGGEDRRSMGKREIQKEDSM